VQVSEKRVWQALPSFRFLLIFGTAILGSQTLSAQDQNMGPEKLPAASDHVRPAPILSREQLREAAHPDKDDDAKICSFR
jgi:hypothetical protein